jgi:hypothetical protein
MNHQAAKVVHPVSADEERARTTAYDGVLLLVFACPGCGWIESRREAGEPESA